MVATAPITGVEPAADCGRSSGWLKAVGLLVGAGLMIVAALLSIRVGSISVSTRDAWNALFHYNGTEYNEVVVRTLRLPRTVIALSVGATLAVAGAMMQAVTRNPLAGPSILGVSSGASFAIVTAIFSFGISSAAGYLPFAFAGALIASTLVFLIGSAGRGGATPIKLALAGVVVSALLSAWTNALLLLDEQTLDQARFWFAGSVAGRDLDIWLTVAPFLILGPLACLFMGHQMNVLSMGDDTARALGMNITRTRLIASALVVLMTGASVAVAGPIGFVGLATPHIVRAVVGPDYRWVLPYSIISGAILLTLSDVLGRVIMHPGEIQVGIVTAFLGAPFLVLLARRKGVSG